MSMLDDALSGLTKGAAMGSVVPGIGTAIGGLAGLASSLVPHIFGDSAAPMLAAAAKAITGADDEPTQMQVLSSDPAAIAQFKVQALKIAADREQAQRDALSNDLAARLSDVQDARQQTEKLTVAGSKLAWGAAVVSTVLLVAWFASMVANYYGARPLSADDAATLRNLALLVAGYWIGTNRSSDHKTDLLANSFPAAAMPRPAAIVPAADVNN